MGGVIASYLASEYSQVKKIVLAAPAFRYFAFEDAKVNIKGFNETLKTMPKVFKDEGQGKVMERITKTPIPTLIEFTNLVGKYQNCIKKVNCPILTIHGLSDKVVPESSTNYVFDSVTSKTNYLVNIKEVSHNCFVKKRADEVKRLVIDFLVKKYPHKKEKIEM